MNLLSSTPTKYTVFRREHVYKVTLDCWFFGEETTIIAHTNWWIIGFVLALRYRAKLISGYLTKSIPTEEEIEDEIETARLFQELLKSVRKPQHPEHE